MIVLSPAEMREIDRQAIEDGIPDILLMEMAGRGSAELADKLLQYNDSGRKVLIFAGSGNNGGDGLVVARFLDMWGYAVKVIMLKEESSLKGNSLLNFNICKNRENIEIVPVNTLNKKEIVNYCNSSNLIIDAILGTGLKGKVRGIISEIIDIINKSSTEVLAVDIPTGINASNGKVPGKAITAKNTATMAFPKLGMLLYPGHNYMGEIKIIDLGMPKISINKVKYNHYTLTADEAEALLPKRKIDGHKGTFGKINVIGGSTGMTGAPALTGFSALKMGAGLVKIYLPEEIRALTASYYPELITATINYEKLDELTDNIDVLVLGPGLGQSKKAKKIVDKLLLDSKKPMIIDADGINLISDLDLLKNNKFPILLTPHPGEMARLIDSSIKEIQDKSIEIAREFSQKYNVYLILKGATTIVSLPDGRIYLNLTGNDGLATAGSGDVLTGIVAGIMAQGLSVEETAILAPYIHGLAGDIASDDINSYSITASDIINYLPVAIKQLIERKGILNVKSKGFDVKKRYYS